MIAIDPPVRILTFPLASEGPFSNRVSLVKPKMSLHSNRRSTANRYVTKRHSCYGRPGGWWPGDVPAGLGRNGPSMASKQASLRSTEVKPRSREAGRRRRRA